MQSKTMNYYSMCFLCFYILVFFSFFASYSSSFLNGTNKCSPQQALDLLLFKQSLLSTRSYMYSFVDYNCEEWLGSEYYPVMSNWKASSDCCKWDGVVCNHFTGDVIALELSCGMVRGTIPPNTTLIRLPHLRRLNLAFNDITGSDFLSEVLGAPFASILTHLNISYCSFTAQIPPTISFLPKLVSLDLSSAGYLKIQPYVFSNLMKNSTHLRELLMVYVNISWVLPTYINISSSLKSLDLRLTGLQRKLPNNIFDIPNLEKLDLSYNFDVTGPLPKVNTSTNISLKWLDLSYTNLSTEKLQDSIVHLKSLTYLDLSSCGLMGPLPKSLVNIRNLVTLSLYDNMLNGTLPSFLFTLPFLQDILLTNNMFTGGLPSELFNCRSIKILSLSNNQFDEEVNVPSSSSFIKLINLTYLDISYNNFRGLWELDTLFSSLPNLKSLVLSYSGLTVMTNNATNYVNPHFSKLSLASCKLTIFPEFLRSMKKLQMLNLSNNDIHGDIPNWAGEIGGNSLISLDLSQNSITGLPRFQLNALQRLYLQSNQIQGRFPTTVCNMSNLISLDMSNNKFYGVVPDCLGNIMSSLSYLYMFNNNFDGVIPKCLGNMSSNLQVINMGNNHFLGRIPNVYNDCGILKGLILNGNHLEGEVPSSLANCQRLKILDLGNNHLNGTFPVWLGDLQYLQVLTLKSNNLHGPIESVSTTKHPFPSLRVLDLSHNGFTGHLPRKYLQNFISMKKVVKKLNVQKYLYIGGRTYSIVIVVKGEEMSFAKIFVDYTIVDLSSNKFEGEIPNVIGSLNSLISLNLSHNNLNGQIPYALGNLSEIESLDMSWNRLKGKIPQSLAVITTLEVLNLSQNNLVGRIPQGPQFNTFNASSFGGNSGLCGFPLHKNCEHPTSSQPDDDSDGEENGLTLRVVMIGYGCGTLLGFVLGYLMLSTRRPKWFNAIVDTGEHMIRTL